MALASAIITSARYDLRYLDETEFTDAELLDYLNRAIVQLDSVLAGQGSDWVHETSAETLASAANSFVAPTDMIDVRSLWIDT